MAGSSSEDQGESPRGTVPSSPLSSPVTPSASTKKISASDFYFGVTLGEGAFARVVHAKNKNTNTEFAIKIMDKQHVKNENKVYSYLLLPLV